MTEFGLNPDPSRLTARQREVLRLVAASRTNAEIGQALGISFEMAKMHVSDILDRLGVDSREEAAQIWREHQRPAARLRRALSGLAVSPLQRIGRMVGGIATVAAVGLVFVALARSNSEPGAPPAAAATATPVPTVELIGTRWDLVTIDGQPVDPLRQTPYLLLLAERRGDGTARAASGHGGCNGFAGEYALSGEELSLMDVFQTLMGCGDDLVMANERAFLHALRSGPLEFSRSADRLVLTASDSTRLEFVANLNGGP